MSEARIEARIDSGVADARLFRPDVGSGPWPLVVFFMDAFGLRPALTGMAARLAQRGYAVLQPNLYWRLGPLEPLDPARAFQDPEERRRLMELVASVDPARAVSEARVLAERAAESSSGSVHADRVGVVGYCMGGRIAFVSAARMPRWVTAAICVHPGGLVTDAPDSPHRSVSAIEGTVYIAAADEDPGFTSAQQQTLSDSMDAAHIDHTLDLYRGKRHGFAVPDLPVYDEAAAERHWERLMAVLDSRFAEPGPG
jgi:carboxymethylenebutenolidase